MAQVLRTLTQIEQVNFLLTNRIPRQLMTHIMGWYSNIESPMLTRFSIVIWRLFASDLDLGEAKEQRFNSLHDCFVRELKPGSRPVDTADDVLISPCDAIIGSFGEIEGTTLYQAKGFPYQLSDLIPDPILQKKYKGGRYITLRLKSSMYHHFHAPRSGEVEQVTYISGDCWNVNPVALKRVDKLYCKNERAVLELKAGLNNEDILMVPVAAVLVASMRFDCLDETLDLKYDGPNRLPCNAYYAKGDEMGYFQHGSTIILFTTDSYEFHADITQGNRINMGQALMYNVSQHEKRISFS